MSNQKPLSMVGINANMVYEEEGDLSEITNPTLKNVPIYQSNRFTKSWQNDIRYILGKADAHDFVKFRKQNSFSLAYDLNGTQFLQYGIAPPAGTGTIAKTLTFVLPIQLGGVQKYRVFDGCITNTVSLDISDYYSVEHAWTARNISRLISAEELKAKFGMNTTASLAFPAAPSYKFWTNLTPQATTKKPLSIDGTQQYMQSMSLSIERNPMPADATANEVYWSIEAGYRGISGTVDLFLLTSEAEQLLDDWTSVPIVYKLAGSPNCDITLTGVKFHTLNNDLVAGESRYVMLNLPFFAETISVTSVASS